MRRSCRLLLLLLALLAVRGGAHAADRFMTAPYSEGEVNLQQGWWYSQNMGGDEHKAIDYVHGTIDQSATWTSFAVCASHAGQAVFHGGCSDNDASCNGRLGNYVSVTTSINGVQYETIYAHLASSPLAGNPTNVSQGQNIGMTGTSGDANDKNHLHFVVKVNGQPVDPYDIRSARENYPPNGGSCGANYLWTACPPTMYTFSGSWYNQAPTYPPGLSFIPCGPRQRLKCAFTFGNTGTGLWSNDPASPSYIELHSVNSSWNQDQISQLSHNWLEGSTVRISTTTGDVDPNGGMGLYTFEIIAPSEPGNYYLYVSLYHPNTATYITGPGPTIHIRVVQAMFGAPANYSTASRPRSVFAGDFNNDGKADMASANQYSNSVSVFLQLANGQFGNRTDYSAGTGAWGVFGNFIDNDRFLDLAVADFESGRVSVLLNGGNGSFSLSSAYGQLSNPREVVVGDFDNDGDNDMATADYGGNRVMVQRNNGAGAFGAAEFYPVGLAPRGISASDVNGDSYRDIITANLGSNTITVLTNQNGVGFGMAAHYGVHGGPFSVAAADLNSDGYTDLVAANSTTHDISVVMNVGNGTFSTATHYSVGQAPVSITAVDINGDQHIDLATANNQTGDISVLMNNGFGIFSGPYGFSTGGGPYFVFSADLDNDRDNDIIVTKPTANQIAVLYNMCFDVPRCIGRTGNIDCDPDDGVDISDLSALIDFLYISFTPLCCPAEANTDGDLLGGIDISDLSALIDYLYISFTPPAACL